MKIKNFIIFILLGLLFSDCKKYPEDKFISIGTSKARLDGEWKINKIEINGENVIYKYNDSLPIPITDYRFWFRFNWNFKSVPNKEYDLLVFNKSSKHVRPAIETADVSGVEFSLSKDKDNRLGVSNKFFPLIPIKDSISNKIFINLLSDFSMQVRMLHNKKLIIQKETNNIKYRLYFLKTRTY